MLLTTGALAEMRAVPSSGGYTCCQDICVRMYLLLCSLYIITVLVP